MKKRIFALILAFMMMLLVAAPQEALAAPKWWERFKEIVKADAVGAADGYLETESVGGAIAGGVKGSIEAGNNGGVGGDGWSPEEMAAESVGLHHNLALGQVYGSGAGKAVFSDMTIGKQFTGEDWHIIDKLVLEYLTANRLQGDNAAVERYLGGVDPSIEDILRRIREGTTGPFNPSPGASDGGGDDSTDGQDAVFSENFFTNLQRTLSILDGEADDPQQLLDEAMVFFLNASLRETDSDLRDDIIEKAQDYNSTRSNRRKNVVDLGDNDSPLDYERIKVTYEQLKSSGQSADIILAWIFVDVLQHSSQYWSEVYCWGDNEGADRSQAAGDNGTLWCWGANFERIMMDPDANPEVDDVFIIVGEYHDLDSDGDGIPDYLDPDDDGDGIPTDTDDTTRPDEPMAELMMKVDSVTARSGNTIKTLDAAPFIKDDRTMVPFRFIGEELGAEIDWIPETRTVTYMRETDKRTVTIEMIIGQNQAIVNGVPVPVDQNPAVAPEIINGRTVVPVRFISETLGFTVGWNPDTREVTVSAENPLYKESTSESENPLFRDED